MTVSAPVRRWVGGTTPYPWPWDGDLAGAGTAVVLVRPADGAPTVAPPVCAAIEAVADAVRRSGGRCVLVTTRPPRTVITPAGAPALLAEALVDHRVTAEGIDGFYGSRLDHVLRSLAAERIILAGAGLETCVHSTMRSANDRGYECLLVADAVAAYEPDLLPATVSMTEMSGGIFGAVADSAAVIAAFTEPAAYRTEGTSS